MKSDYRGLHRTGRTYNGLLKALERQKDAVMPIVKAELRAQVRRRWHHLRRADPWVLLAVDGSKEDLPRTRDHERAFGIAHNGFTPQAFITAIAEVHTGLLWDWRLGHARASERHHLLEMIPDLPVRMLGRCIRDVYIRRKPKQSRHCVITTNTPITRLQPPNVRPATAKEKKEALKYAQKAA